MQTCCESSEWIHNTVCPKYITWTLFASGGWGEAASNICWLSWSPHVDFSFRWSQTTMKCASCSLTVCSLTVSCCLNCRDVSHNKLTCCLLKHQAVVYYLLLWKHQLRSTGKYKDEHFIGTEMCENMEWIAYTYRFFQLLFVHSPDPSCTVVWFLCLSFLSILFTAAGFVSSLFTATGFVSSLFTLTMY